ncbi:MAG: low molecular weight phosphotyrosine protein phosphatase [Propionibacteriaceae bacterium]|nr:low molecular weight phosphotyrosine protein phosphatase [Propionibacteriaceae bacterium]
MSTEERASEQSSTATGGDGTTRPQGTWEPRHIIFVCWGNICRSPMAERIAEKMASDRGLDHLVFSSAATSREEIGHPIDPRARRVLTAAGYRADGHAAHQITSTEIHGADLVIGMEQLHLDRMRRMAPDADNFALMTDFDPTAAPGSGIDDPWYGPESGFQVTLTLLERAVSGLLDDIDRGILPAGPRQA